MTAKLIKTTGQIVPVMPRNGNDFTLSELYRLVGCEYIQIIRPPSSTGAIIVCDEEGKLNDKPLNLFATQMWQEHAEPGSDRLLDDVVGDVLLCHESQIE